MVLNPISLAGGKIYNYPISLLHLLFFSTCDGAVRGNVISFLQGKTTSRLVYILPGMFILHQQYKKKYYYVRKCYWCEKMVFCIYLTESKPQLWRNIALHARSSVSPIHNDIHLLRIVWNTYAAFSTTIVI